MNRLQRQAACALCGSSNALAVKFKFHRNLSVLEIIAALAHFPLWCCSHVSFRRTDEGMGRELGNAIFLIDLKHEVPEKDSNRIPH